MSVFLIQLHGHTYTEQEKHGLKSTLARAEAALAKAVEMFWYVCGGAQPWQSTWCQSTECQRTQQYFVVCVNAI